MFGQLHEEKCLVNDMGKSVWSTTWGKVFGKLYEEKSQLYGETCMVNCLRKVLSQLYEEKWSNV